ncbi:MAG: hypothetical protein HFH31_03905 [Bacilli bacterium]|nr:hypothetical protein [Bacilli bacterium]
MKRSKLLLVSLFAVLALTGCGKKNLTCTMDSNISGMESKTTVSIKFNGNKVDSMKSAVDVTLPDSMKDQKQTLIDSYKNSEAASDDVKVSETNDGFRVEASANAKDLGIEDSAKYDDVKKVLESAGYTCK